MKTMGFITVVFAAVVFFSIPFVHILSYTQTSAYAGDKVAYELPYPGILPDNPLYYAKIVRDRVLEFATRDHLKKAQLYLLLSDKRIATAQELAKKGKTKMAITAMQKAEKYALKIPPLLRTSKEQGVTPPEDFKMKIKQSNEKHAEVIDNIKRSLPQGELNTIKQAEDLNKEIRNDLNTL